MPSGAPVPGAPIAVALIEHSGLVRESLAA
jgi:hypothetical protein